MTTGRFNLENEIKQGLAEAGVAANPSGPPPAEHPADVGVLEKAGRKFVPLETRQREDFERNAGLYGTSRSPQPEPEQSTRERSPADLSNEELRAAFSELLDEEMRRRDEGSWSE